LSLARQAGQLYWFALVHTTGAAIQVKWAHNGTYTGGYAAERSTVHADYVKSDPGDLLFALYACHGCRTVPAQLVMSHSAVVVGTPVAGAVDGEPYTEGTRSAAAQSFTATQTGLITGMDLGLRVGTSNAYNRALLCLWITTVAPQGSLLAEDLDDGNQCFNATGGTDGFVTVTFARPVYMEAGIKYFLTMRHGAWYAQTTRFAALPNTSPMRMAGGMEPRLSQTDTAIWLGAKGNPYWPENTGFKGEALLQAAGSTTWVTDRDMDLAFRFSYCSTGFPYVLNLTTTFDFEITAKIAPLGCCHARTSDRAGSRITITGANFFPSQGLQCAFMNPDGSIGAVAQAIPLTTDFRKAVCVSQEGFDPYKATNCPTETSCLGTFLSITNDGANYPAVTGAPRTTLGDQTRKLLVSDLYVSTTGHDYIGDGTFYRPYATIQRAIRAANQVDRVTILNGEVLKGSGNRDLKHLGKDIIIQSYPGTTAGINCENAAVMSLAQEEQREWIKVYPSSSVSEGTQGQIVRTPEIMVIGCRTPSVSFSYTPQNGEP